MNKEKIQIKVLNICFIVSIFVLFAFDLQSRCNQSKIELYNDLAHYKCREQQYDTDVGNWYYNYDYNCTITNDLKQTCISSGNETWCTQKINETRCYHYMKKYSCPNGTEERQNEFDFYFGDCIKVSNYSTGRYIDGKIECLSDEIFYINCSFNENGITCPSYWQENNQLPWTCDINKMLCWVHYYSNSQNFTLEEMELKA